jgi:hypothetical protein
MARSAWLYGGQWGRETGVASPFRALALLEGDSGMHSRDTPGYLERPLTLVPPGQPERCAAHCSPGSGGVPDFGKNREIALSTSPERLADWGLFLGGMAPGSGP